MTKNIFWCFINIMNITVNNYGINFNGYDVLPLRGLYMQGSAKSLKRGVYEEMSNISKKNNLTLYVNQVGVITKNWRDYCENNYLNGNIWAQDTVSFILDKGAKTILWNSKVEPIPANRMSDLTDFYPCYYKDIPRGGNYYIGFKPDKSKWMIISSKTVQDENEMPNFSIEGFRSLNEKVTKSVICNRFDIKPENLYIVDTSIRDLDEIIRPIGYPYVLINSADECLKNIYLLKNKFKNDAAMTNLLNNMVEFVKTNTYRDYSDKVEEFLKNKGFIPIKIGGWYSKDINFINALAYKDKNSKISYITNSTRDSIKGLEYLEELFARDLREKVDNINDIDFISGGKAGIESMQDIKDIKTGSTSAINRNQMMSTLANYNGGIHCMTSEIPDFDKIV